MLSEPVTTKAEWPTLINNPDMAYFDSAASTQTHVSVLNRMKKYYEEQRCNVNRGDYRISQIVSEDIERSRESVAEILNCKAENIVFTTGATQGLNMIAEWHKDAPAVIITEAEHTANIMPWIAQGRTVENGRLIVLPITDKGMLSINEANKIFEKNPHAVLSVHSHSNVSGIPLDYKGLCRAAHNA
mgnify:FL=1